MKKISENCACELNLLANLYLRGVFIYETIVDILEKDELLVTITESCKLSQKVFKESFEVLIYLNPTKL